LYKIKRECSIKALIKESLKYKNDLIRGNIAAFFATALTVIIPLFIPLLVDELLLHKSDTLIGWVKEHIMPMSLSGYVAFFLVVVIVLRVVGFLLNIYQVKRFLTVSKQVAYNIRKDATEHLKRVSLKEYETSSPSAIASKLVTDVNTIDSFIGVTVSKFIISILTLIFSAVVLLIIDWKLALFILVTNPIVVYFTAKMARRVGKLKKEENRAIEIFQSTLSETLELMHQIKATNKERYFFTQIDNKAKILKDKSIEFSYRSDKSIRASFLIFLGGYELFRSVSILAVAYGGLSVGLMLAVFGYLWIMMTPTQDIINFQYALASAKASCKRVNSIFEMKQEPTPAILKDPFLNKSSISIEARDIKFAYNKDKEILKSISFKIAPKAKVAIVGPSGSGKTTLANLLVGFYPLEEGDILYNGVSIKNIELSTLREVSHLILQNPKLFNDTLRFNLTLGKEYSENDIQKALEIAQLKSVVANLERGLDTVVGRDGIKLSGGQRQRVAIARMILLDPKIVIFDESTSALDIHSEAKLFHDIQEYLKEKIVITIAHRLSTIEKAQYIYVIEDGYLKESGTPQELLSKSENYFSTMI